MVDARSLIDILLNSSGKASGARSEAGSGLGGLGDILGQVLGGKASARGATAGEPATGSGSGSLEDLLRNLLPPAATPGSSAGAGPGAASAPKGPGGALEDILRRLGGPSEATRSRAVADDNESPTGRSRDDTSPSGGLSDILRKLGGPGGSGAGDIGDLLKQVFGQATSGAKEGAAHIGASTGLGEAISKATGGKSADELLAQLKDLIDKNQLGAGTALGGLGALIFGTKTGRGLAADAAKIGGLVLISGLAYKAWQNYQSGKPLIGGPTTLAAAPVGSGFEAQAVSNDMAQLYLRAMIAAAAADGRVDAAEHEKLLGGLKQAGVDAETEAFLKQELRSPASIDELASSVSTEAEAVQLYTAARIAIEPDAEAEVEFLVALAARLGLEKDLVDHVEATARGVGMRS